MKTLITVMLKELAEIFRDRKIIINGLLNRSEDSPEIHLVRICVGAQEMKAVFASTFAAKISSPA